MLDALKTLLPAQFEEVIYSYGIPPAYLPTGSQVERAIAVIRYAQARNETARLETIVAQLSANPAPSRHDAPAASVSALARKQRNALYDLLNTHFSLSEIEDVLFRLNLDRDQFSARDKTGLVRQLIETVHRAGGKEAIQWPDLVDEVQGMRPELEWTPFHAPRTHAPTATTSPPTAMAAPQTLLILSANPANTARLRLDQEVRDIEAGLRRASQRDNFKLVSRWAVQPQDVRRALLDEKPTYVHFCGHGEGETGLLLEDHNGQAKAVSGEALAGLFKLFADQLRCVVLNACYSEVQAQAIATYIPYVIGMNTQISDTAASNFSVAFYDALGAGESVPFAYEYARNALELEGIPEALTPVLKQREAQ